MRCPREIAEILCDILRLGLLRIRAFGWYRNPERCVLEADHLHNLPALLVDYKRELLGYYWSVERVGFIERSTAEDVKCFEPSWKALANHVASPKSHAIVG